MKRLASHAPVYALLTCATALAIAPFAWMLITALKTSAEVNQWPPTLWPSAPTLDNFRAALATGNFPRLLFNSTAIALFAAVANVLLDSMAAFAFSRLQFPGKDALFGLVLATMMLPAVVTIIPLFLIVKSLPGGAGGWLNTYLGIAMPGAATAFGIFLFRQYFDTLPRELDEAAMMDGAGPWWIYWHIALPLARPAAVTVAVYTFVFQWNDFLWPLVAATDSDMYTVQVGLSYFTTEHGVNWPLLMAGAVLVTLPVLVLYAALQRHFVGGLTMGSGKE